MDKLLLFIFVFGPMLIAVLAIIVSVRSLIRRPSLFQTVAVLLVVPSLVWSTSILYWQALVGWPNFIPHIFIATAVPIVVVQVFQALPPRDEQKEGHAFDVLPAPKSGRGTDHTI